jgi:hypothetical protein
LGRSSAICLHVFSPFLIGATMPLAWTEDRATLGSDPSADPGAKTEAGYRGIPRFGVVPADPNNFRPKELRAWHKAINPIQK